MTFVYVESKIGQQTSFENFLPLLSSKHPFPILTSVGVSYH
jgi:hypothetical protein